MDLFEREFDEHLAVAAASKAASTNPAAVKARVSWRCRPPTPR